VAKSNIGISWTNEAMNSLVGCQECFRGCDSCYAKMRVYRFSKNGVANRDNRYSDLVKMVPKLSVQSDDDAEKEHLRFTGQILFNPAKLYAFLRSNACGNLVFVDEFSDLLHEAAKRSIETLWEEIGALLNSISTEECTNYFKSCGYVHT
jgi:protein gp37